MKHQKPDCRKDEYSIFITHKFLDGELLVEIRCLGCGAITKGRFHPDNFIEAIR